MEYVFKVMIIMMNHGVKGSRGKKEIWKDDYSKNRAGSIDCSFLWSWETVGDRALEALERMS